MIPSGVKRLRWKFWVNLIRIILRLKIAMFSRIQTKMYRITVIGAERQLLKILCLEKWWPRRAARADCKVTSITQRLNRMQWKPEAENYFRKANSWGTGQPDSLGCIPHWWRFKSLIFRHREECPKGKFTLYSLSFFPSFPESLVFREWGAGMDGAFTWLTQCGSFTFWGYILYVTKPFVKKFYTT